MNLETPGMSAVMIRIACVSAVLTLACQQAEAVVLGKAVTPSIAEEVGVTSFSIGVPAGFAGVNRGYWIDFSGGGDTFGYAGRDGGQEGELEPNVTVIENDPAFAILDDSAGSFAADNVGIIGSNDENNFFGISDTVNPETTGSTTGTPGSEFTASWVFDITGASGGLVFSVDFAAMGDFEGFPGDQYDFEYSFDGETFVELLRSGINDTSFIEEDLEDGGFTDPIDQAVAGQDASELPAAVVYTMESGVQIAWNDPLTLGGMPVTNQFQTYTANIGPASSNELTIRFVGNTDSGSEGVAFRDILIEDGGATPLFGDYNDDGKVDAADYTLWRDGGPLANEQANPGSISQDDYDVWVANYGNTAPSAALSVPEPAAAALALLAFAGLASRRV